MGDIAFGPSAYPRFAQYRPRHWGIRRQQILNRCVDGTAQATGRGGTATQRFMPRSRSFFFCRSATCFSQFRMVCPKRSTSASLSSNVCTRQFSTRQSTSFLALTVESSPSSRW